MSRRKQSNPKPLKVEEGWNEEEGGKQEKKVGGEEQEESESGQESKEAKSDSPTTSNHPNEENNDPGSDNESSVKDKELCEDEIKVPTFPVKRESRRGRTRTPEELVTRSQSRGSDLGEFSELESTETREGDGRRKRRRESESSVTRRKSPLLPESGSDMNGALSVPQMSPQQLLQGLPYLHLLPPSFRNDAARFLFMPPILPPELSGNGNSPNGPHDSEKAAGENLRSGLGYFCKPCNIKFSSARTLDAHQTYYCSFRREADKESVKSEMEGDSATGLLIGSKKRERESGEEDRELMTDESMEISPEGRLLGANETSDGNPNKMTKTGKLYACMYCSYSADKKVSLNRHMRMHSGGAVTPVQNANEDCGSLSGSTTPSITNNIGLNKNLPEGVNALERYCQDCDIQFSSIKTFRVHKQYYCRTRHVLKAAVTASATGSPPGISIKVQSSGELGGISVTPVRKNSGSPVPSDGSPASTPGPMQTQPFIVLPTNPLIIVPYCFIQAASILPGNVLPSQNVLVVLPNGSVQGSPFTSVSIPSPSTLSQGMASLLPQSASAFSVNVKNSGSGSSAGVGSAGCSISPNTQQSHSVFNDPKDILRKISSANKTFLRSGDYGDSGYKNSEDVNSSQNTNEETVHSENGMFFHQSNQVSGLDEHSGKRQENEEEECEPIRGNDEGMPAIDLTLRKMHSIKEISGDDEKENQGTCLQLLNHPQENSETYITDTGIGRGGRKPSAANILFTDFHRDRELCSPSERLSSGSGGKRTPRPSSTSISSSCSTPPALCEPKVNGVGNRLSPVAVDHDITGSVNNKSHPLISMMMSQSMPLGKGGNDLTGLDMVKHKLSFGAEGKGKRGKISQITTQLPGGAILTASGTQSLSDLLMPNSPELGEILAKISPQLLVNSRSAAGSPIALNPQVIQALSQTDPEVLMRMFDSAYLTNLQHSIQQQQQQQQQHSSGKRGYSKCVECDIVFYKHENYLVHKEHYCAARGSNGSPTSARDLQSSRGGGKDTIPSSRISSCSSPAKSELDAEESQASLYSLAHRTQSSNSQNQMNTKVPRKSTDSASSDFLPAFEKTKSRSPQGITSSSISISPVPISPSERKDKQLQNVTGSQHPCVHCGVKYSTIDNLKAHQNFYCTKNKSGNDSISTEGGDLSVKLEESADGSLSGSIKGLSQCGKCKLAIPEDQHGHSKVCLGSNGALPYGTGGPVGLMTSERGMEGGKGVGWKCPCCNTYSPTVSQAQKHLEIHSIKAFKCSICGYRGNTLRGMRTHIRTHFDKRVSDLLEGEYMTCITANDVEHNVSTPLHPNKSFPSTSDPRTLGLNHQLESANRQTGKKIKLNHSPPSASVTTNCSPSPPLEQQDVKVFPIPEGSLTMDEDKLENNNRVTNCSLCNYTSSYRGNIIRHMKLVHKIPEESADKILTEMNSIKVHPTRNIADYKEEGARKLNASPAPKSIRSVEEQANNVCTIGGRRSKINGREMGDEKNEGDNGERNCTSRSSSTEEDLDGLSTLQKKEKPCGVKYCKSLELY